MSHWMRKHQRAILIVVVALVGIPFVFWGGGFGSMGRNQGNEGDFPVSVAQVGPIPISSQDFLHHYNDVRRSRSVGGTYPTAEEMVADGTVERILEMLVGNALVTLETSKRTLKPDREYLIERLKEDTFFQDEAGRFDTNLWNRWVEGNERANWNTIYAQKSQQVNREIFANLVVASARVLDLDVKDAFVEGKTKIKVKYAAVEPEVNRTEEQFRAYYEENGDRYETPKARNAEFVAISLEPLQPAIIDELVDWARGGEDFAELAKEYSEGPYKTRGGDLGWVMDRLSLPEHQKILFTMEPGQVSDPVEGPFGIHIFKVEEVRDGAVEGTKDVKARQIEFRPTLGDEEIAVRKNRAEDIAAKMKEEGGLEIVAAMEGLEIRKAESISARTMKVEDLNQGDSVLFRRAIEKVDEGEFSEVIEGRKNLYIAKVTDVIEATPIPYEEAREDVEGDAVAAYKRTPEYEAAVQQCVNDIKENATDLADAKAQFPELALEIGETEAFAPDEFLFSSGLFLNSREAHELVSASTPGTLAGPIKDLRQVTYFLELVERTIPDRSAWTQDWETEREQLRATALSILKAERERDYLQHLRERAQAQFLIHEDYGAIASVLGLEAGSDDEASEPPAG